MGSDISRQSIVDYITGHGYWHHSEIVTLPNGRQLRGKAFKFPNAKPQAQSEKRTDIKSTMTVNAFLGIPFAKPPTGERRFQKPEPADPWALDYVLECTKFGPRCPHEDMITEIFSGLFYSKSEDCLQLNVFAPSSSLKSNEKLPVMMFIHGGGFTVHSAAHYGDIGILSNMCTKGVIVVTIQYRLGFFGFLCTGDSHAPGNMGLWDQALALQWVHDNIDAFGGDTNNITVFGQSAGAASVDFLTLSPYSRDLFQKAIVMSGSASCSFALNEASHVRAACLTFAQEHGFKLDEQAPIGDQNRALLEFYRKQSTHVLELSMMGKTGYSINRRGMLDLTPVIDGDFLPRPLHELRAEAPKKLILTGVTEYEGLLFTAIAPRKNSLRGEAHKVIARELKHHGIPSTEMVNPRLKELYFDKINEHDHANMTIACVKAASDVLIVNGVWSFADEMARLNHEVYLYSFEHFHLRTFGVAGLLFPFKGATHCSELPYLFHKGIIGGFHNSNEEMEFSYRFTTMFINFAKCGNPNESNESPDSEHYWRPLSANNTQRHLRICATREATKMVAGNFCGGRPAIWRQLISLKEGSDKTKNQNEENVVRMKEEKARIFGVDKRETGIV